MNCPNCNCANDKVINSRPIARDVVRRRRACSECDRRWSTYEIVVPRGMNAEEALSLIHGTLANRAVTWAAGRPLKNAALAEAINDIVEAAALKAAETMMAAAAKGGEDGTH